MTLLEAVAPVAIALAIPATVRLLRRRPVAGLWRDLGLVRSPVDALAWAAGIAALALGTTLIVFSSPALRSLVTGPGTTVAVVREAGGGLASLWTLLLVAGVQTALAEEILFRGAIAKPLIARLGFVRGNTVQAALFGAMHLGLYAAVARGPVPLAGWVAIAAVPTTLAASFAWLNDRVGGGSIVPGWLAHALANAGAIGVMAFAWA